MDEVRRLLFDSQCVNCVVSVNRLCTLGLSQLLGLLLIKQNLLLLLLLRGW